MATYTADAFNASLPTEEALAGYMDLELRAIKARLNSQIGASGIDNLGARLATAEASITSQGALVAN